MTGPTCRQRTGFTLLELLVVIAIVAVLAGLTTAAVMIGYSRLNDAKNATDILQMNQAMENFKAKFKRYPPSRIKLCQLESQYTNSAFDQASLLFLKTIWTRLGQDSSPSWTTLEIDWSGGTYPGGFPAEGVILEGDQCLVFFLGGIPSNSPAGVTGFSDSPTNPAKLGGTRITPFFAFNSGRLVTLQGNWQPGGNTPRPQNTFFSYADIYANVQSGNGGLVINAPPAGGKPLGQPFVYFATNKQANQYNPFFSTLGSDCTTVGAMPYNAPPLNKVPQFQNPSGFQIISAGVDRTFGSTVANGGVIYSAAPGGTFTLNTGGAPTGQPFAGMDDRANFNPNILAAGNPQ